jgi:hypothetical protein
VPGPTAAARVGATVERDARAPRIATGERPKAYVSATRNVAGKPAVVGPDRNINAHRARTLPRSLPQPAVGALLEAVRGEHGSHAAAGSNAISR